MKVECFMLTDKINRKKSGSDVSLWIVVLRFSEPFEIRKKSFENWKEGGSTMIFYYVVPSSAV